MKRIERFLEKLYDHITRDYDRIIPVVGSEGYGKSTFILEATWCYEAVRDQDPTPATVLDTVTFDDREAFRQKLLHADPTDPISVMDAAHVLHKKDAMNPEQKQTERSLLDIRIENYVIFLGYQDWGDIPTQLQSRRAENLFYIPRRGVVHGFNRQQLDEKYDSLSRGEWPEPALVDTFPSLEGTELWDRFQQIDAERKRARLQTEDDDGDAEVSPQAVAEEILDNDVAEYVKHNEFQDRAYYNKALIRYDYPELSDQQAEQVREALAREQDPADLAAG